MSLVVFTDTNALIAMHCFKPAERKKSLASEVAEVEAAGECTLLIREAVADELREVVARDFPNALPGLETFLERYGVVTFPKPDRTLLKQAEAVRRFMQARSI